MTRDYAKMEESNLEQQCIITSLEYTYQDLKEQHVAAHIELDKEKQHLTTQIQNWKGQFETAKVQLNKHSPIIAVRMNNRLKEFEELLLNNTLLKVQNQASKDKNPKWKEWWQTV
jgi:hypothetical protein